MQNIEIVEKEATFKINMVQPARSLYVDIATPTLTHVVKGSGKWARPCGPCQRQYSGKVVWGVIHTQPVKGTNLAELDKHPTQVTWNSPHPHR